jgi:WD40 repeat protein
MGKGTLKGKATLKGTHDGVVALAFSPDGALLASGGTDEAVKLWDVKTGEEKAAITHHHSWGLDFLRFNPDGTVLVSARNVKTQGLTPWEVKLWDVKTGKVQATAKAGHGSYLGPVEFGPDGTLWTSTTSSPRSYGTFTLLDVKTGEEKATVSSGILGGAVTSVAFNADGTKFAMGIAERAEGSIGAYKSSIQLRDMPAAKKP